jgi:hypothetical protein
MALKDVLKDMEGYQEIAREIQVLRKYGSDYSSSKGVVEHIISLLHPKRITLKLSEIQGETSSSKTFRFAAKGGYLPPSEKNDEERYPRVTYRPFMIFSL